MVLNVILMRLGAWGNYKKNKKRKRLTYHHLNCAINHSLEEVNSFQQSCHKYSVKVTQNLTVHPISLRVLVKSFFHWLGVTLQPQWGTLLWIPTTPPKQDCDIIVTVPALKPSYANIIVKPTGWLLHFCGRVLKRHYSTAFPHFINHQSLLNFDVTHFQKYHNLSCWHP